MAKQKSNGATGPKKCIITRKHFVENAPPAIAVVVNGIPMAASRKEFDSGSFGYYLNGKLCIEVGGVPVNFQLGFNIIAVGSKEAE